MAVADCFRVKKDISFIEWIRIYALYRASFPRCERKPFSMILSMRRRGKTDVWYFAEAKRFAGFASTINGDEIILLDYLAVKKSKRGRGIGRRILQTLKVGYGGRGIFVEIESPYEDVPDREQRLRRKSFYMDSGLLPSRVMAAVFGVKMELLCWNCSVDFSGYHAFYRDNYSAWAAENILEEAYPKTEQQP